MREKPQESWAFSAKVKIKWRHFVVKTFTPKLKTFVWVCFVNKDVSLIIKHEYGNAILVFPL